MGKVFTPQELMENRVPERGVHAKAATFVMEELFGAQDTDPSPHPYIESGLAYGSVQLGNPGPRSDLDMLINYQEEEAATALQVIGKVSTEASVKFNVPIGIKPLYVGALADPLEHDIDRDFAGHLLTVARNGRPEWIRGNPIPNDLVENCATQSLLEFALIYCGIKVRAIAKAIANPDPNDVKTLQQVFELPDAICRKAFPALRDPEIDAFSYEQSKREILNSTICWARRMGREDLIWGLMKLVDKNLDYTHVLDAVIEGELSNEEYAGWLDENRRPSLIHGHTLALEWITLLREELHQRITNKRLLV
ncbi:MAG TPA: hypothetical protein VLH38_01460 [Patescibacteria group bacterium]|nr:hypothetical protein [Patescibacteria group bacterium]